MRWRRWQTMRQPNGSDARTEPHRLPRSAHHLAAALGNQPRRALIAHVNPQPAQRDAEPVAQADQEIDVRDAPDPPCEGAAQLDASEIDDRLALADLRQAAGMLVTEWSGFAAAQPRFYQLGDIAALLLGGRCDAGDWLSVWTVDSDCVADGEDVGMTRYGEVGQHLQALGAVGRCVKPFGGGRCAHAGGPDDGCGVEPVAAVHNVIGGAFGDRLSQYDFDADTFERALRVGREIVGKARPHARPGLDQDDASLVGVDVA